MSISQHISAHSIPLKSTNNKSLLILLSSAGRAKFLQPIAIAVGNYRSPHINLEKPSISEVYSSQNQVLRDGQYPEEYIA